MKIIHIKIWQWIVSGILLIIFLALFLASTLIKNWVVNNSENLIGRKINIEELHINYFEVSVQIKDFTLYENDDKEKFVSFDELYVNFDPSYLFKNQYYFSEIRLSKPYFHISQNKDQFNFSDLIPQDSTQTDTTKTESTPLQFTINNIKIADGQIIYQDLAINNTIDIDKLALNIPTISWNSKDANLGLSFNIGEKGLVSIKSEIQNKQTYTINLKTKDIQIDLAKQNLKQVLKIDDITGLLTSDLTIKGDIKETTNIKINGTVAIDSLYITDADKQHLLSFDHFNTDIKDIDLKNSKFDINTVVIKQPKISARLNKDYTNIEKVLGLDHEEKADTTQQSQKSTQEENPVFYSLEKVNIENGTLLFEDNTLNRNFSYEINTINISATQISPEATKVPVEFSMLSSQNGDISGNMLLNLKDTRYANLYLTIKKLGLPSFSPYSEYYIASPVTKGYLYYDMKFDLTPTELKNANDIRIERLNFGNKTKDSTAIKTPIKLALYVIKDKNDRIAFNLPVSGDPSKPGFKYTKILWQTLSKFFVKVAVSPINAMGNIVSIDPEKMKAMTYSYDQDSLMENQIEILENIRSVLTKKPMLIFELEQHTNFKEEKKFIAISLTKKEFAKENGISPIDNSTLNKIDIYDSKFLDFINYQDQDTTSLKPEDICLKLYPDKELEKIVHERMESRNTIIKMYFKNDSTINNRIKYTFPDFNNIGEEEKKPYYEIKVDVN